MLSAATTITAPQSSILNWKYATPPSSPATVTVRKVSVQRTQAMKLPLSPPSRAQSVSDSSSRTSEPSLKRKQSADPVVDSPSPAKRPVNRSNAKPRKSTSRQSSVASTSAKKARPARVHTRRDAEDVADYHYTPPPKRARSQNAFGSLEKPVPRRCLNTLDGCVSQHSSQDVINKLLHTYRSCKLVPRAEYRCGPHTSPFYNPQISPILMIFQTSHGKSSITLTLQ